VPVGHQQYRDAVDDRDRRAFVLTEAQTFVAVAEEAVEVAPGEVLVEVTETGVCASDVKMYAGTHPVNHPPLLLGHEFHGRLLTGGARVAVGQEVAVFPLLSCGQCRACTAGRPNTCAEMGVIGAQRPGALAGLVAVPEHNVVALDPRVPADLRVLAEPLTVAVHAARRAGDVCGRDAFIIGGGPIGLLVTLLLQSAGAASVTVSDSDPVRRALVGELTAAKLDDGTAGHEDCFDIAYECVGSPALAAKALRCVRPGGSVVLVGIQSGQVTVDGMALQRGERAILGTQMYTPEDFAHSLRLLANEPLFSGLPAERLVRRHPAAKAPAVFAALLAGERPFLKEALVF